MPVTLRIRPWARSKPGSRVTLQVRDGFAQRPPFFPPVRLALGRAIDAKRLRMVQRRLDPQHLAVLVVNLDGVACGVEFEPHAFGAVREAVFDFAFV